MPSTLQRRDLNIIAFSLFMLTSGMSLTGPMLPIYVMRLGDFSPGEAARWSGFIEGIAFVMAALFSPVWGVAGDRRGRKLMVLRAFFGMSLTMALLALAQTPLQMFFVRMLHGCLSGAISATIALVSTRADEKSMGSTLGFLHTAILAGTVGGPFLGGILADTIGFRPCFLVTSGVLMCCGLLITFFITEDRSAIQPKDERRYTLRDNFRYFLNSRQLMVVAGLFLLAQTARMGIKPILPLFVAALDPAITRLPTVVGAIYAATGLVAATVVSRWGKRADKKGFRNTLIITLAGATLFSAMLPLTQALWQLVIALTAIGFFHSGNQPLLQSLIAFNTVKERRGSMYGTVMVFHLLGNATGPMLGGLAAGWFGFRPALLMLAVIFFAGWLLARFRLSSAPPQAGTVPRKDGVP